MMLSFHFSRKCVLFVLGATISLVSTTTPRHNDNNNHPSPKAASRPFDAQRSGFVMAEGGGVLILESLEHAQARGAKIYCELAGYGASGDAYHITSPEPTGAGLSNALERALRSVFCTSLVLGSQEAGMTEGSTYRFDGPGRARLSHLLRLVLAFVF